MKFDLINLRNQNPWWKSKESINEEGKIKDYKKAEYRWNPRLKDNIDLNHDIIYTLRGPRQVGKTTLVKLKIRDLLEKINETERIFYYSCDLIDSKTDLTDLLNTYLDWIREQTEERLYIFLDEISSVDNWQVGIKHLKDIGKLKNCTLLLTGSHSLDIEKSGETLPGRRGNGKQKNKILTPMKFAEYLEVAQSDLKPPKSFKTRKRQIIHLFKGQTDQFIQKLRPHLKDLDQKLNNYLKTGGFPKTINQFKTKGEIKYETYELYQSVIFGDIYKQNLERSSLRDIIQRVIETRTSRVGWDTLKKNTSIKHHDTVKKYVETLEKSFVLNILHKVNLNKKIPTTSAYKKIYFSDPFIFHSMRAWINGYSNPFKESSKALQKPDFKSKMVEEVVMGHLVRLAFNLQPSDHFDSKEQLFYWSNSKEIDFILKYKNRLYPVEVGYKEDIGGKGKWIEKRFRNSLTPILISKNQFEINEHYVIVPASLFLFLI
ncbi:MAG: ATP-binding protein [Candidatus Thermoplasmatota archaeon]